MPRSKKLCGMAVFAALAFQGCAHPALEKRVDEEVAQETAVKSRADLRSETGKLIENAPGLTPDQRSRLLALRESTRVQVDALWLQSLKLRSLLLKDMISADNRLDEIELIKKRIRELEARRLSVTFSALDQANTILGREPKESRQRIMGAFMDGHGVRQWHSE